MSVFPSDNKPHVQICNIESCEPCVTGCVGNVTVEMLQQIEVDCFENSADIFENGEGDYLFAVSYEPAQVGEYGRIETDEHWQLDLLSYRPLTITES